MLFWTLAGLLLLCVLAVLAWPLLRRAPGDAAGEDYSLNLTVYRQQLKDLEADLENGVLTEEQARRVRQEIEQSLLEEVPEDAVTTPPAEPVGGRAGPWPVALVAVLVTAASVSLYQYLGTPESSTPHGPGMPGSVDEMVQRLETRLQNNPDDLDGWFMLSRSYMVLGRYDDAVAVMQRLHRQLGDEPGILIRYAHALAMANGGSFRGRPAALIQQVLEADPDNPSALWFAGLAAEQEGDYRTAVDHWQKLVPRLQGQDEALQKLQRMIGEARARLGGDAGAVAAAGNAGGASAGRGSPQPAAGGGASVRLRVTLADDLRDQMDPDAALFIFARAPQGPPMPLAVVKRRAGDLPFEVELDDGDAVMPAGRISQHDSVTLVARISSSGRPQASSGDLQGEEQDVAVGGGDTVSLVIDTKIP